LKAIHERTPDRRGSCTCIPSKECSPDGRFFSGAPVSNPKRIKDPREAVSCLAWVTGLAFNMMNHVEVERAFEAIALLAQKADVKKIEFMAEFRMQDARADRCWDRQAEETEP
jgi:hypothetical protein